MRLASVWLSMLFSLAAPLAAVGQECLPPPSLSGSDINVDTKASLGFIPKFITSFILGNDFRRDIRNVFIEHPETMQWYVVLVFYYDGCIAIQDDKTLDAKGRQESLRKLRESIRSEF